MNVTSKHSVLVQGILEPLAYAHVPLMQAYGTNLVAGVSPGHGGQQCQGIPVFDMVTQARAAIGEITTSLLFNQPYNLLDAALEAIAAGIRQLIILTEGMPPLDVVRLLHKAEATETLVLGPNCPGLIIPNQVLLGIHPTRLYTPGPIGIISCSGTLTYEVARHLTNAGLGQSLCVGIGSDTIVGSSFSQWLQILDEDDTTQAIVLVGEVNGHGEQAAAQYISDVIDKPVIAYLSGQSLSDHSVSDFATTTFTSHLAKSWHPTMLINTQEAMGKLAAFKQANIPVAHCPSEIPDLVRQALATRKLELQS